jgi:SAM-dependent methyltransferase
MGYTGKSIEIILNVLKDYNIKSVCDLGAQNNYSQPYLPAPYMKDWYESRGIKYVSIDMNGENGSLPYDLSKPLPKMEQFDLVCDFGTGEHVNNGFYQCLKNIDTLCKVGGIIVRENPKTGNWPGHGFNYIDMKFYIDLCKQAEYKLFVLEEHPAMNNINDGWNVIAAMQKTKKGFINEIPEYYNV